MSSVSSVSRVKRSRQFVFICYIRVGNSRPGFLPSIHIQTYYIVCIHTHTHTHKHTHTHTLYLFIIDSFHIPYFVCIYYISHILQICCQSWRRLLLFAAHSAHYDAGLSATNSSPSGDLVEQCVGLQGTCEVSIGGPRLWRELEPRQVCG